MAQAAAAEDGNAAAAAVMLTEEQKNEAWQQFEAIIYSNLERIL